MKKLLILASILLVTSVGYTQNTSVDREALEEACRSLSAEDCRHLADLIDIKEGRRPSEDDGWKYEEILKQLTKRHPASVWSKISQCNANAGVLIQQISRLVRGSDAWIDQVDKMYLKYSSCVRKAQPKNTAPGGAGEGGDPDKATAF